MDKKILKAATDAMRELGLSEIRIKDSDTEVFLKRETATPAAAVPELPFFPGTAEPMQTGSPSAEAAPVADCTEVKSPLIGIFYEAPSPETAPFVRPGDAVKKGDILCIVEAMKMMNEICAETDGTILEICAENGALVEFGQTLFKIAE